MKLITIFTGFLTLLLCSLNSIAQTVDSNYLDGEIYVKYKDNYPVDFSKEFVEPQILPGLNPQIVKQFGIVEARFSFNKIDNQKLQRTVRIKVLLIDKVNELIEYFSALPFTEYAEKIPAYKANYIPNDIGINKKGEQWHLHTIQAVNAWDFTKGDTNIVVAVVDQEFDINHPDLKNNVYTNWGEIAGNGIDDDNNGYIDDIHGWDVADHDNNVIFNSNSNLSHGTPCAGLVASTTDNSIGIASIGFNIKFLPVKACYDKQTDKLLRTTPEGIAYAAGIGADVISCSFGSSVYNQTSENAIKFALSKNCIVVAGAGNENDSMYFYPAAYTGVISVAASEINDSRAYFTSYGSWIDVSAPGAFVKTTLQDNSYINFSGTSAACPITAGLLGLMKSYLPTISNTELQGCLLKSADNIDSLNKNYAGQLGSGRINAYRALQCIDSIRTAPPKLEISIRDTKTCPAKTIELKAVAINKNMDSLIWYLPGSSSPVSKDTIVHISYIRDSIYSLSVVSYNKYGKDSLFLKDYVEVSSDNNYIFFYEDFEDKNRFLSYVIDNPDWGETWNWSEAHTSLDKTNKSLMIDFYNYHDKGQRDRFLLPTLDFSNVLKAQLSFQHAYSSGNRVSNDSLIIYASTDSGKTYPHKILALGRPSLVTSTFMQDYFFIPQDDSDWCFANGNNCFNVSLDSIVGKKNVIIKFESYNDNGNDLFIDNISILAKCNDVIVSKPICNFNSSDTVICEGGEIQFYDKSYLSPKAYQWILKGGIPDTSFLKNPVVKYTAQGSYDVTLIVGNPVGYDTLTLKNYIRCSGKPVFVLSDTQKYVCPGDSVYFSASGTDSFIWYKHNTKETIYGPVVGDRPVQSTLYSVKGYNKDGCYDSTKAKSILVPLPPPVSVITKDTILEAKHSAGIFTYTWYLNDTLLIDKTKTITPTKTGNYKVKITDTARCTSISADVFYQVIINTQGINNVWATRVTIHPNPASGVLYISGLDAGKPAKIIVADMLGRLVLEALVSDNNPMDVSALTAGLYFVTISQKDLMVTKKIRIE